MMKPHNSSPKAIGLCLSITVLAVIVFSLAILLPSGTASSSSSDVSFTVDIAADTVDFIPGDGSCSDLQGNCSLRAAIQEANALAGDDTINVPLGNVTLSITGHSEDAGATGDLDIIDNLTIIGSGATNIDGDGIDRVFHIHDGITVTLQALTVINGKAADDAAGDHRHGGGIYNGESRLILQGVEVINNEASDGSGPMGDTKKVGGFGGGIFNSGLLTINDSVIRSNRSGDGYTGYYHGGDGGGIYVEAGSAITLTNSTVSENTTGNGGGNSGIGGFGGDGGGLYIGEGQTTAVLIDSYVLNNVTGNGGNGSSGSHGGLGGDGGGIFFIGDLLSLTNSHVSGNRAGNGGSGSNGSIGSGAYGGFGGGFYANGFYGAGVVTLVGSTVNGNQAGNGGEDDDYGGDGGNGGGIYVRDGVTLSLTNSQVNGNAAGHGAVGNQTDPNTGTGGQGGEGGGLYINQSEVTLINSTVNGNIAGSGAYGDYQGGVGGRGGAIFNELSSQTLTLDRVSLNGNVAGNGGNGGSFAANGGHGGGLYHFSGNVSFNRAVISSNITGNGGGPSAQGSAGRGGGIFARAGAELSLVNSTVSGNTTGIAGGGTNSYGGFTGGIVAWGPTEIHNSTISHNSSTFKIGGLQPGGYPVNVSQSIIANNSESQAAGPDCYGTITSEGYVLVENMYGCSFAGDTTTNITGVDPALGPLQNNGGGTLTHALLFGSPAKDAGDPVVCPATDQRGFSRPFDGDGDGAAVCDIGAFEAQASESTTLSGLAETVPTAFGATMATLTRNVSSTDPLTITVTLSDQPPGGGSADPGEMPLLWEISAAVDSGLDLELELCYTDEQLGSLIEADLKMYRNDGSGWTLMGGTVDTEANCVTLSGVTALSDWTLATALPVSEKEQWLLYLPMIVK